MPGPKPMPARLKLLRGNPGQYPIRQEPQPEQRDQVPEPPGFLKRFARDQWDIVATELHRLGLLTKIDEPLLAAYCAAYGRWYEAEDALACFELARDQGVPREQGADPTRSQLMTEVHQATTQMIRLANEYGLTPCARARLGTPPSKQAKSKFGDLLAG